MTRIALRALAVTIVLLVLTAVVYPLAITGVAQLAFGDRADGSLVYRDGRVVGSRLIGQSWEGQEWFYGRPSAIDYDASTSGGSNLGPTSDELTKQIRERIQTILALEGPYNPGLVAASIPVDLLTASASGLDPSISPAAAELQAPRVAAARQLAVSEVRALIRQHTTQPPLDAFGQPVVNVLELNLALDALSEASS